MQSNKVDVTLFVFIPTGLSVIDSNRIITAIIIIIDYLCDVKVLCECDSLLRGKVCVAAIKHGWLSNCQSMPLLFSNDQPDHRRQIVVIVVAAYRRFAAVLSLLLQSASAPLMMLIPSCFVIDL